VRQHCWLRQWRRPIARMAYFLTKAGATPTRLFGPPFLALEGRANRFNCVRHSLVPIVTERGRVMSPRALNSTSAARLKRRSSASQRLRAAIEAAPYENPKLSAVAMGYLTNDAFAERLERAIDRSDRAKLIEARRSRSTVSRSASSLSFGTSGGVTSL
jgi:hypothetical protein